VEAEFDEFRDLIDSGEILGGEKVGTIPEVTGLAVDFEGVGHAAGLSALPAVGAAATEDFAGEALARVGNAESSMNKNFQGKA
jgi:hypothetical protein